MREETINKVELATNELKLINEILTNHTLQAIEEIERLFGMEKITTCKNININTGINIIGMHIYPITQGKDITNEHYSVKYFQEYKDKIPNMIKESKEIIKRLNLKCGKISRLERSN